VGFYSELNDELRSQIYAHYSNRVAEQKPVMYLLLPEASQQGQVALVLPTEGGLRQRQIQTFDWSDRELPGRLSRLQQGTLRIANRVTALIPQIDWVFYPGVKTAEKLAQLMAEVARRIEQAIPSVYKAQGRDGYLPELYESFQKELLPTLKLQADDEKDYSFADIYAQTVAYGLFTARVFGFLKFKRERKNPNDLEPDFYRDNAWEFLPKTNPFLRELFKKFSQQSPEDLGEDLVSAVSELLSVLRATEMEAVLSDFEQKIGQEDIIIRFYEDFLKAYKPRMRELRGVYYTPQPVVSYIVRSVDYILKKDFGLKDGLADATKVQVKSQDGRKIIETHKVLITDPAVGTATFLHEVINHIYKTFESKQEQWSDYVAQDLLPRLLGFELLMAPYAVAHMKLGLQLAELGYQFDTEERLRVYLTNTLQEAFRIPPAEDHFSSLIWGEADAANRIKEIAPVMVILGNPPYSGLSANDGEWINGLLRGNDILTNQPTNSYFEVDGKPLNERKHWLNDDYVKFIRFGQWRIEKTGYGVLACVTNHGYLDNPTFRGMRQSLMRTFDDIYLLDLHGNSKKKEKCPDGSKDENVFDIQQGVSICLFVKKLGSNQELANVYHADLYGMRDDKYSWLKQNSIMTTQWKKLTPQSPFYLFVPQNTDNLPEYKQGWKITDIFPINSTGIVTARDSFVIDFETKPLLERIQDLRNSELSDQRVRNKYFVGKGSAKYPNGDTRGWKLPEARRKLRADNDWDKRIASVLYRPFDNRSIYYTDSMVDWSRREVMQHMLAGENLGLILARQTREKWDALVSNQIVGHKSLAAYDINSLLPLYLYPETTAEEAMGIEKRPNISPKFYSKLKSVLRYTPTPEAIFYYIYAIFHSPTYRTRYAEFLKIDFPRVPLTSDDELFCQLAKYGEELVALHLMNSSKLDSLITQFVDQGGNRVVDARHPKFQQGNLIINRSGDRFTGVPENVWNFYVGGYQVCHKWLKDRRGRTLSDEDILHYQRIVVALKQTIELMTKIDAAIPEWPIQ
jgi:predicted helicase/Txe/YoeB family toxin of Txe-Axe toxin-antitoxin module